MSNLAVKIINVSLSAELIGTHPRETYIYTYTHGQGHVDYQHRSVMLNCSKLLTINTMSKLKKKSSFKSRSQPEPHFRITWNFLKN